MLTFVQFYVKIFYTEIKISSYKQNTVFVIDKLHNKIIINTKAHFFFFFFCEEMFRSKKINKLRGNKEFKSTFY